MPAPQELSTRYNINISFPFRHNGDFNSGFGRNHERLQMRHGHKTTLTHASIGSRTAQAGKIPLRGAFSCLS
jgi:hypothetical protein